MPAKIDLIGKTFGKLKVIEETPLRKNKSVVWKCQCECGNIEEFSTKELRSDGIIQCSKCGSYRQPINNRRIKDYSGQKFNYLTLLEKTGKKTNDGRDIYKCLCECGNITYGSLKDIKSNHKVSCGCKRKKYNIGDIINNREIIGIIGKKEKFRKGNFYYKCKCLFCGRKYESLANTLDNTFSCGCLKSKGEFNIIQILQKNKISYKKEYVFPNTKYRFDFAIMNNNNVIRLIEFDGEQHYKEQIRNSGWSTYEKYEYTFNNDEIKNNLAKENHIPLVRIPYWERNNITLNMLFDDKYLID